MAPVGGTMCAASPAKNRRPCRIGVETNERIGNTDFSVIVGMTYGFLPFAILPLFVSIDRLDPTLVAAGRDLYASGRQAFLHVTLPLTMPGIIAASIPTISATDTVRPSAAPMKSASLTSPMPIPAG